MSAAFLTPLEVALVDDHSSDGRGTWRLLADLVYLSGAGQTFSVPAGFVTDFASVPRIPVAFFLAGDSCHEAAVLHDWLYTVHPVDRAGADALLREACEACSVPAWRRWLVWAGVRVGGFHAWTADGQAQPVAVGA